MAPDRHAELCRESFGRGDWICLDAEASGADPQRGDRVIEIAAVWPEGQWHSLVLAPAAALVLMTAPFPEPASGLQSAALSAALSRRPVSNDERSALAAAGMDDSVLAGLASGRRRHSGRRLTAAETQAVLDVRHGRTPRAVCAAALCGIRPDDLSEAPRWEDPDGPSDTLAELLDGRTPFMYEAVHDIRMINHEQASTAREPFPELERSVCLRHAAHEAGVPGVRTWRRSSLAEVCDGIGHSYSPHNALEDALAAAAVLEATARTDGRGD